MTRRRSHAAEGAWTWWDEAALYSAHVVAQVMSGRGDEVPQGEVASFPPRIAAGERFLTQGWYRLREWTAPGNGTYAQTSGVMLATGAVGVAASAAFMAATALSNSQRRAAAAAAAAPRWHEVDRGNLHVSTAGFYLASHLGVRSWPWAAVIACDPVDATRLSVTGSTASGSQVAWVIESPWASLLFGMWAAHIHPQHPTFESGAWLPRGWESRASAAGKVLPTRVRLGSSEDVRSAPITARSIEPPRP
ncbi:hypothetical protein [Demequina capsici]|uniref:Uncharacterized protein n=1 Tax=Demequina capsici TaxID=3075620 RepID=A0AA96J7A6_9MICO|nr:hypothetical protein [Demequina sp. OYTSA14]WNM25017.1 hypothetical protein RN606_02380 [Demequina sp. OYTSA14]